MLTSAQIDYARKNPDGLTYAELAKRLGAKPDQVYKAARGITYKDHPTPPRRKLKGHELPQAKLKPSDIRALRINRHGKPLSQWAKELGVSEGAILQAFHGVTYAGVD